MSEIYYNMVAVVLFFIGVVAGSVLQDSMSSPVIIAQGVTVREQADTIHKQREALLITINELASFKGKVEELRESQESSNNLLMKVEDFYKIDLREARKGSNKKLNKLVAKRFKKFKGMGGE
jgi:hypothetical protein